MRNKFKDYINKLFKNVRDTEEVRNVKEEIVNDLIDLSKEIKKKDKIKDEDNLFEKTIDTFGDLKEVVKEYKKETNRLSKKIELPKYKLSEELINSISHGLGAGLSIFGMILCIIKSDSVTALLSTLVYTISSFLLYLMSCLYHSLARNNAKRIFRIIDHCSIYLLIAGTYTPLLLLILPFNTGLIMCLSLWLLAIIGIVINAIDLKKFKVLSMVLYFVMGWFIVFNFSSLWNSMNHNGIYLLLLGGVIYTIGGILYGVGKKKKYMHSVFHILCLIASICFFCVIYIYAL